MAKKKKPKKLRDDVEGALGVVELIMDTIEEVEDWKKEKNSDFFESIEEKAKDIGDTIRQMEHVTDSQLTALENMLEGVRKWLPS